jgi:peptidoglycan/LPS O-acetylase OafA/YrhL
VKQRIAYLDSMRGLAAFSVLIYHFLFSLDTFHYWDGRILQHILSCVFNGSDAVSFFFVLSGLVLSHRYFNRNQNEPLRIHYPRFVIQRVFRIYPVFVMMLLMSFLYAHREELSFSFFAEAFNKNNYNFIYEAILIRNYQNLYTPGWTLSVEIIISLLVPVFIVILSKLPTTFKWLLPISILMSAFISSFIFHFMLGVWLGKNYENIRQYNFKKSRWYALRYPIYLLVFLMFSIRHIDRIQSFHLFYYYPNHYLGLDFFHITGFASYFILWKAINDESWQKILHIKPLIYLGKISYSLYLTHWFVIFYLFIPRPEIVAEWLGMPQHAYYAGFIFCISVTLMLSVLFYYVIEQPFNSLGKRISIKLTSEQLIDQLE